MGQLEVDEQLDEREFRAFMRKLLDDVTALETMIDSGMIESGVRRIGAEQEMFLVDDDGAPAPVAMEVLEHLPDEFTTELALFNLEANLKPFRLAGQCLRRTEREIRRLVARAREVAREIGADVVLTGILPTLRQEDLILDNMTPMPRYRTLNDRMLKLRGGEFRTLIKGLDELQIRHDNILLEACNTSFQLHFQAGAQEFAKLYNLSQAVTGPVLAAGGNSPLLLQHRLWHETRIALFQQSIDVRSGALQQRGRRTRVSFGDRWLRDSVIEIFREDLARLRVVISDGIDENSLERVQAGGIPSLGALRLFNGTIYRWNRPCYGVHADGEKAHLRIENRVLPSGPTPQDEVANAAFYFGLMSEFSREHGPVARVMEFDHAKMNFLAAARQGLSAQFHWVGGERIEAGALILDTLLPLARKGLERKRVDPDDIDRYLGILEARVGSARTGAQWCLDSWDALRQKGAKPEERTRAIVDHARDHGLGPTPVHEWEAATIDRAAGPRWQAFMTIGQFMKTDIFTVRPGDIVDLAASMMQWEHIRHVPVEDDHGQLVGIVSHRDLLALVGRSSDEPVAVQDIMKVDVITVGPRTRTVDAIRIMRDARVGCLPVVEEDHLVGIVTETDFLDVARSVFEEQLERVAARNGTAGAGKAPRVAPSEPDDA